ncbi:type II membrane protein [Naganishia albida]|nr:type II membrane protein [Naganishia albida]
MKNPITLSALFCFAALAQSARASFDCRPTIVEKDRKGETKIHYDLQPLSGLRIASKTTETPPSTNEAKVSMTLCGDDTLPIDDKVAEEDQCPPNTKVCLTLLNHKSSSSESSRVTAVIPIWSLDTPEEDVKLKPRSKDEGLDITVDGPEYAGIRQQFELNLICAKDSASSSPEFVSYGDGKLVLSWETPSACEKALDGGEDSPAPGADTRTGGGGGFFHVLATVFWLLVGGLTLYFAIGMWYNYTTYGAKGLDLLPHKEFWRDLPTLFSDLVTHITSNIRGSSNGASRGGYTAI